MSADIEVHCQPAREGWSCRVLVGSGSHVTLYQVSVSLGELATYAPGATDPSELVACSFDYLLEREPASSILRDFAISDIARYFPDYQDEIARRI